MIPGSWPSLDDEVTVARDLFGDHRGRDLVASWLDSEASRVGVRDFARQFSEHISLPGIITDDYLHRLIHTSHGDLLGGIRFYGRDVSRPFVEIIAHGFDDLDRLRDCVRDEWSMFAPESFRLCARPGRIAGRYVEVDVGIYVARYRDMRPCTVPSVSLTPFAKADNAIRMVRRRYEHLAVDDSTMARNVSPANPDDLCAWHQAGQLRAIVVDDEPVGLLAVAPGRIRWIDGDEINEEVIAVEHAGHGYAAVAQSVWAEDVSRDPNELLVGTIDHLNVASRKTAERAGRNRVLDQLFVRL